ncbi:MAG: KdsC family phosphatase [Planctomycetota bacterium]|jgi:3-deoxy-D-manno-octulosonate 8-phosphate phosphatase (KDO 8-P phosphatase)
MDFAALDLLILDVDGVLTSGRVTFGAGDSTDRSFDVHDGCCIKLWHGHGGRSALLSGRRSAAVGHRAGELGIETVVQSAADKLTAYQGILSDLGLDDRQVCYVGDDLPDLAPMSRCAFPVAVGSAVPAVKQAAQYVTRRHGGQGAVAEVIELILRKQRRWSRQTLLEGESG